MKLTHSIRKYFRELGRIGGKSKSPAKIEACKRNAQISAEKRRAKRILSIKLLIILVALSFVGCTKQVDRLLGNGHGDTKEETYAKYPWLNPDNGNPHGPEFCAHQPQICHEQGIVGY